MERFAADPEVAPYIGHLWTPATGNSLDRQAQTGLVWASDNAAFGAQWNAEAFQKAVLLKIPASIANGNSRPLFVPCPDVVGDSRATLDLFHVWGPTMRAAGLSLAFVLQDGSENQLLPWSMIDAVFVGGSRRYLSGVWGKGPFTEWKESKAAADLIREAKRRGKKVHAGRVNGLKRLRHFYDLGVDTADGSSLSMYPDTWVPKFVNALRVWQSTVATT
jgi:hypothetical protein